MFLSACAWRRHVRDGCPVCIETRRSLHSLVDRRYKRFDVQAQQNSNSIGNLEGICGAAVLGRSPA